MLRPQVIAPRSGWRRPLFVATGGAVNLGPTPTELREREFVSRIKAPVTGCRRIAVVPGRAGREDHYDADARAHVRRPPRRASRRDRRQPRLTPDRFESASGGAEFARESRMGLQSTDQSLDAPTLIPSTDTFVNMACDVFRSRLGPWSFRLTEVDYYRVRFTSGRVFVEIQYMPSRAGELNVWTGMTDQATPPFALPDVLRAAGVPPNGVREASPMQAVDDLVLGRLLHKSAELLIKHGAPFLAGERDAFQRAEALRSSRAHEYTSRLTNRPILSAADAAWQDKDYPLVRKLLEPIRNELDVPHRRRLDFAARRS
jgi:hypothetical protein